MAANSTQMFSGFNPNSRNSSKVLAPPGGGSSIMFDAPVQEEKRQSQAGQVDHTLQQNDKENAKTASGEEVKQRKGASTFQLGEHDQNDKENLKNSSNGETKQQKGASTFQLGEQDDEKAVSSKKAVDPLTGAVLGQRNTPLDPKGGQCG